MESWEIEVMKNAFNYAERFNRIGLADPKIDQFIDELRVVWINECSEWREAFIKKVKSNKIVFLIDVLI